MDEFSFIEKYLAPLTFGNPEALSLKDDAAIFSPKSGYDIVITKDAIAEGTHFFKNDDPYKLAKKLLRVNLSDLAAKGAIPYCCFLALILPENTPEEWLEQFAAGLKDDLSGFSCFLAGGDTTAHNGGVVLTLTALGHVTAGKALLRSGARAGDGVFVTGTIGDSYLGLQLIKNQELKTIEESRGSDSYLISRYHVPQPRISVGTKLSGVATSCTDISDGLLADLENICNCSQVGAEIMLDKVPLSISLAEADAIKAITGGDDYELLFTAPENMERNINDISEKTGIKITKIGKITGDNAVTLLNKNGEIIPVFRSGYRHKI